MGVASEGPLAQQVEGTLALPEPAHGVVDAPGPEPLLRQREALADTGLTAHDVVERHTHVVVDDLGVPTGFAGAMVGFAHGGHIAQDVHARSVGGHDDHRIVLVRHLVVAGLHHHDEEVGDRRVRREPLVPVDDPLVAIAHRFGAEQCGVGTGTRFSHRETTAQFTGQQRLHPLRLLRIGATHGDEFGVAAVGCVVTEDARGIAALTENLVHQAELHLAEAEPTHVGRQVGRPQALALHFLFQRSHDLQKPGAAFGGAPHMSERLERDDLVAHERAHPGQLCLELGLGLEVPCHDCIPPPARSVQSAPRGRHYCASVHSAACSPPSPPWPCSASSPHASFVGCWWQGAARGGPPFVPSYDAFGFGTCGPCRCYWAQ